MQTLTIKKIDSAEKKSVAELEKQLEKQSPVHILENLNWANFPYKPSVQFRIAHTGDSVLLKYYVQEKSVAAKASEINGDVYKDSCVEFFISPNGDGVYYNFEFSCIGIPHVGYGAGRHNRELLPSEIISKITANSSLGAEPFAERQGDLLWELFVQIPISCFIHDSAKTFSGWEATGNFYKCGDDLSEPHFVTWNPIETENPDYHCPEFFGKIKFE